MGEKGGRLERYGGWWKEREGRNGKRRSWRKVRSYRGDIWRKERGRGGMKHA